MPQNGSGKFSDFTHKALQAIRELGVTHVWYTGIIEHATQTDYTAYGIQNDHPAVVKGIAGSPYAIKDYYDVTPDLADDIACRMSEFEALVKRTHIEGMKILIDFVPNHVARQYHSDAKPEDVKDLGEADKTSEGFCNQNNFYYIPQSTFSLQFDLHIDKSMDDYCEFPAKATGNDLFNASVSANDWYETVKLNYGVDYLNDGSKFFDPIPDTWLKMRHILLFWAAKGVDGFRCDMAGMVPVEFWGWVIGQVKEQYPGTIFIAEIYEPDRYRDYLTAGKFDYLYDKVGLYDTLRDVACGYRPASEITGCWQRIEGMQAQMLNFMENHDEQRIASDFFLGNGRAGIPPMVVAATMNVNPVMLYFGQELGESGMDKEGFSGLDGRTTIFDYWSVSTVRNWRNDEKFDSARLSKESADLRNMYKKLLNICHEPAISQGTFFDLMYANQYNENFNPNRQYAYIRHIEGQTILICTNFDTEPVEVGINIPVHAFDYLKIEAYENCMATDLLTGEKLQTNLLPNRKTCFSMEARGVRVLEIH